MLVDYQHGIATATRSICSMCIENKDVFFLCTRNSLPQFIIFVTMALYGLEKCLDQHQNQWSRSQENYGRTQVSSWLTTRNLDLIWVLDLGVLFAYLGVTTRITNDSNLSHIVCNTCIVIFGKINNQADMLYSGIPWSCRLHRMHLHAKISK